MREGNGTNPRIRLEGARPKRVSFADFSQRVSAWKVVAGIVLFGAAGAGGMAYGLARDGDHERRLSAVETHIEWIKLSLQAIGARLGATLPKE